MIRYSKKHGRYCPGHNVVYLTCQSGSLGSFSREVGLAKQRTDFSVRTRPSFEFISEAWQALQASVLLLAVSAENKETVPGAWSPDWEGAWTGPSGVYFCQGFSSKIARAPVGPWTPLLLTSLFSCVWEAPRPYRSRLGQCGSPPLPVRDCKRK